MAAPLWGERGGFGGVGRSSDLLWALACLTDELQAAGAPCGDWPRPICPLPLRRTELMCENPSVGTPFHLPPSFKALSLSRLPLPLLLLLLLHIRASLSVAASLSRAHIAGRGPFHPPHPHTPTISSHLFPCPSAAATTAASWCCSHFSSPEAHSWVRGNV